MEKHRPAPILKKCTRAMAASFAKCFSLSSATIVAANEKVFGTGSKASRKKPFTMKAA
jgi:hypothetical protein